MNDDLDPIDPTLEDRLRAHFADRAAREPLPGDGAPPLSPRAPRSWWQRPPMLAAAAALLVVAFAGALALRDDDPEELETTNPSTTTTEATTPEATSTTTMETTTTEVPATTTLPDASSVRSVVVASDGVLVWWDGSRFVRWQEAEAGGIPVPLVGGEEYALVGLDGTTVAVGAAPVPGCGIGELFPWTVAIDGLEPGPGLEPPPLAITGVADPTPRRVEVIGASAYIDIAADVLAGLQIDDDAPDVVQVLRTDFEGDGTDEVLVVAERLSDPETLFAQEGDYSVLFLRQVVDGEPVTTVIESSHAAPTLEGEMPFVFVSRVSAVADVNGDGTMEFAMWNRYYEGSGTSLVAVEPSGATRVHSVGCGA